MRLVSIAALCLLAGCAGIPKEPTPAATASAKTPCYAPTTGSRIADHSGCTSHTGAISVSGAALATAARQTNQGSGTGPGNN